MCNGLMFCNLAQMKIEGLSEAWNGVLHPFLVLPEVFLIVALALFAGQRFVYRHYLAAFMGGGLLGLVVRFITQTPLLSDGVGYLMAAAVSAIVLMRRPLASVIALIAYGLAGVWCGLNAIPSAVLLKDRVVFLAGAWIGMGIFLINTASYAALCPKKPWVRNVYRALGGGILVASLVLGRQHF
mgnify:CR=1 FL=1